MKIDDVLMDEGKLTEGCRIPLELETKTGKPVDAWVDLLYVHSDEAQKRFGRALRADQAEGKKINADNEFTLLKQYAHCLIAAWSFDEELTMERAERFVRLTPYVRSHIVFTAQKKHLFFPSPAESSSGGQKKKSNS